MVRVKTVGLRLLFDRFVSEKVQRRCYSSQILTQAYNNAKNYCMSKKPPPDVESSAVFATNELDLREVQVYGFDYDYTLASYKESVDHVIYNLGKETLVHKLKYPEEILKLDYQPGFAVRGLHYDIQKGLLMKVDSFHQIQMGSVYRGLTPVSEEEVLQIYGQRYLPIDYLDSHIKNGSQQGSSKMAQLADLFSVPEMSLLCNVTEYFLRNSIHYNPEILFRDVKHSVQSIHPSMHKIVQERPEEYLDEDPQLRLFLDRLIKAGKKLFLVTNSPFSFVNKGLTFIVGPDWRDLFDVIIVQARKPKFFTDKTRPFRMYDAKLSTYSWDRVTSLHKGNVYQEGTVWQLQEMTGWSGEKVLYFGDHPYSDLADASLTHGWRTGAIIRELADETTKLNCPEFKWRVNWLQVLQQLIEQHQDYEDEPCQQVIRSWIAERDTLRLEMKQMFNKQFGSIFRTYNNPTYFSRRLFRFADVYTSKITNFLNYSVNHTFYSRRGVLPHEYRSWFV